jgi:hypothetical protein
MNIQQLKDMAKDVEFLSTLDDVRRQWLAGKTGCGCNNVKIANFILTVCKVEFDAYCQLKGIQ